MAATPVQTFDRVVEGLSGDLLNASGYQHIATGFLDTAVTATVPIDQGRFVHIHGSTIGTDFQDPNTQRPIKLFRPGASAKQVPYVVIRGTRDLDSQGVVDASVHGYATLTGTNQLITGFCCTNSVELATREFDATQTYLVNDPLTSPRSDSSATAGQVTNQSVTWGTTNLVGQVTSGKTKNVFYKDVLHMLTSYQWGSESAT